LPAFVPAPSRLRRSGPARLNNHHACADRTDTRTVPRYWAAWFDRTAIITLRSVYGVTRVTARAGGFAFATGVVLS